VGEPAERYEYRLTPAQVFADAVWAAGEDELTPTEAMVLLAYAAHTRRGADRTWMTQRRIMQQCKIHSGSSVVSIRARLVRKGWLDPVDSAPVRGGRTPVYRLAVPAHLSESDTPAAPLPAESDSTTAPLSLAAEQSGAASEPLPESGAANEPLDSESDTTTAPLSDDATTESGAAGVSLGETKRYTVHSKAVGLGAESGAASGQEPLNSAPPEGGARSAPARAAAHMRARAREDQDQIPLSKNGKETLTKDEALALLRRTLPPGKPMWKFPRVFGTGPTPPPSTSVDDLEDLTPVDDEGGDQP